MKHHTIEKLNVPRETFENTPQLYNRHDKSLNTYLDQLLWWNKRVNLVSRNVSRETVRRHIEHSLLLSQLGALNRANIVVDAGTGGGLPGIPLALVQPEKRFILNDIVSKKCLAVKQMVQKTGAKNVSVFDGSIEDLQPDAPFLLISKHAFKINDLYHMTKAQPWRKMVLYKGEEFQEELRGINDPLTIKCHNLTAGGEFYKGKAIVVVHRN